MALAIVDGNCMPNHLWENGARPTPGANHFLLTPGIHRFNSLEKLGLNKGPFL
jgi:hypothetical protein